jgi:hypothetical protein
MKLRGKPVPVVICHTECPVVSAGVLCLRSATKRLRSDRAHARSSLSHQTDMSGKQSAKELPIRIGCNVGQPLQPVRTNFPCLDARPGLSATYLSP